jgi:hypothetical protein
LCAEITPGFPTNTMQGSTMKKLLSLIAMGLSLSFGAAHAADAPAAPAPAAKAPTTQQSKMATCNADAAGKKGDERKAFMKECLSAKPAAPASDKKMAQQEKMKACNKEAGEKTLKGDPRKAFMKECLSK